MSAPRRVLVTGAEGQLGRDVTAVLEGRVPDGGDPGSAVSRLGPAAKGAVDVCAAGSAMLDVTDRDRVGAVFDVFRPHVVVHAGAFTAVDACESEPERAFAVNALGTRNVAEAAWRTGAHLCVLSTDYVFDGSLAHPYDEWQEPAPRSVYGRSKLAAEREAAAICPGCTVVRTAWVSGAHGANMTKTVLRLARQPGSAPLRFVDDQRGSPTFTADLAPVVARLSLDARPGVFHVTNQGDATWYGFARAVLAASGLDPERVEPISTAELDPPRPAPRPADSRLDNAALRLGGLPALPEWPAALERLVHALAVGAGATR